MNLSDVGSSEGGATNITVLHTWMLPVALLVFILVMGYLFRSVRV